MADGMVLAMARRAAGLLPASWHTEARRWYFRSQIARGRFASSEPEFARLETLVREGDWALDVGANVGHYTHRLSALVGAAGRVVALEPMPETFALLAANSRHFAHRNVTLLNVAASSGAAVQSMAVTSSYDGQPNYYRAAIASDGATRILTVPVDALDLPSRVSLVKIDVEGHELDVLDGMMRLLQRDRPALIVETDGDTVEQRLAPLGYSGSRIAGSPNLVLVAPGGR